MHPDLHQEDSQADSAGTIDRVSEENAELSDQLDPSRNGGRHTGEEVIEHMKVDPLVLWAWNPGAGRRTPPLSHEKFVEALEAWVSAGMPRPQGG